MPKLRISIRPTEDARVVELEMTVPADAHLSDPFERLLRRHGASCIWATVIGTPLRRIVRAKIRFIDGLPADTTRLSWLLEDLALNDAEDSSPRAA